MCLHACIVRHSDGMLAMDRYTFVGRAVTNTKISHSNMIFGVLSELCSFMFSPILWVNTAKSHKNAGKALIFVSVTALPAKV